MVIVWLLYGYYVVQTTKIKREHFLDEILSLI